MPDPETVVLDVMVTSVMQDFKFQAGAVHVSCELESTEAAAETESPVLAQVKTHSYKPLTARKFDPLTTIS